MDPDGSNRQISLKPLKIMGVLPDDFRDLSLPSPPRTPETPVGRLCQDRPGPPTGPSTPRVDRRSPGDVPADRFSRFFLRILL